MSVTGVGSYPGVDPDEAARVVAGELSDLVHLPELPNRGPGADLIGRASALLVEFPLELWPSGWRVAERPGRDTVRASTYLSADLDAFEEHTQGYTGLAKIQVAGPWTLAATIELRNGERMLSDPGAVRDLNESLAEGLREHVANVRSRLPHATLVVQVDEPALTTVLDGRLPTASGYSRHHPVEEQVAEERLRDLFRLIDAVGAVPVAHSCAAGVPIDLVRRAGAAALSLDATHLTPDHDEAIGTAVESGTGLWLGVVGIGENEVKSSAATPSPATVLSHPAVSVDTVRRMWHRIGFSSDTLTEAVVLTPRCGLAGASDRNARAALEAASAAARVLREDPEGSLAG